MHDASGQVSFEWMPLYWDKLIADTTDLSAEEFGVYMLLLNQQWTKLCIPSDVAACAKIGRVTPAKMRRIREAIGDRLKPYQGDEKSIYSEFMEEVRAEQIARFMRRSTAGKTAAQRRWSDANGIAIASKSHSNRNANAMRDGYRIEKDIDRSPSARDSAGACDDANGIAIASDALSDYLLDVAIDAGLPVGHHKLDLGVWRHNNRETADKIVAAYGLDAGKIRAKAFVDAVKSGKITSRNVTVGLLLRCWAYRELDPPAADASRELSPGAQSVIDDIRREEESTRGAA